MSKKILVVTGSPRHGGNSDILADSFTMGAVEAGHQVIRFDAGRKKSSGCVACETCFSTGHPCSFLDDFDEFAGYLMDADMIAIFTPVYWWDFPSAFKAMIDKLYCFFATGRRTNVKESFCVICGGEESTKNYQHMVGHYELVAKYIHWKNLGHVIVPGVYEAGDVLNTPAVNGMYRIGRAIQ